MAVAEEVSMRELAVMVFPDEEKAYQGLDAEAPAAPAIVGALCIGIAAGRLLLGAPGVTA